jgi:hypothetical protein
VIGTSNADVLAPGRISSFTLRHELGTCAHLPHYERTLPSLTFTTKVLSPHTTELLTVRFFGM